ncbi:MAG: DMT family transporter [Alphaproteobacteria bacterium]|nr:DMT family transporter [Alphaproteobacteria bacterium]
MTATNPLTARLKAHLAGLPPPIQGALWMLGAATIMSGMNVIVRIVAETLHPFEAVFFRNLFALAFMVPWVVRGGYAELRTGSIRLYFTRAAIGLVSMLAWFYAITVMPLADAVAFSFTAPLFGTILAATVLHEVVRIRRWAATLVGFLGVVIIVRPGIDTIDLGTGAALLSAATTAISVIIVKRLTRTESATVIVAWLTLMLTPMSLLPALTVWVWPDWAALAWLALLGFCGVCGHWCMARAFAAADASLVMVFDYARLPLVAALAYFVFAERTDMWTWIGAAVIAVASIYTARREALLHRSRVAAATVAEQAQAAERTAISPNSGPGGPPR